MILGARELRLDIFSLLGPSSSRFQMVVVLALIGYTPEDVSFSAKTVFIFEIGNRRLGMRKRQTPSRHFSLNFEI